MGGSRGREQCATMQGVNKKSLVGEVVLHTALGRKNDGPKESCRKSMPIWPMTQHGIIHHQSTQELAKPLYGSSSYSRGTSSSTKFLGHASMSVIPSMPRSNK